MSDMFERAIIDKLGDLKQRVADLTAQESIKLASTGLPYFPALTQGSVLFAGSGGLLSQDNANFFWDDTNNRLGVGTTTPRKTLDVNGQILATDAIRAEGYNTPPTGEGLELGYTGAIGYVTSYKRTDSTWKPLVLRGSTIQLTASGTDFLSASTTGYPSLFVTDTATNNVSGGMAWYHRTSATPAPGFGADFPVVLHTSTNVDANAFLKRVTWGTATNGSQKAQVTFFVYDTAARNCIRMDASGTAAMIGFLGANAVVRQNITGTRTGTLAQLQTVVANLLTGLATLGLITDSTA
jgi:hypothetical protein